LTITDRGVKFTSSFPLLSEAVFYPPSGTLPYIKDVRRLERRFRED
jgi:hypothetical protein